VSRHFLWLGLTGRRTRSKRGDFFCLVLDLELELGRRSYVGLWLESCLAWGVNCSRGAVVGMEGDSLLDFITRSSRLAAWCVSSDSRRVCVSWHSTTPDSQGTFRYVPQAARRRTFARPHFGKPLSGWPDAHTVWHRQSWHSPLCAMQNACTHAATASKQQQHRHRHRFGPPETQQRPSRQTPFVR
jgi:hypothetical protein